MRVRDSADCCWKIPILVCLEDRCDVWLDCVPSHCLFPKSSEVRMEPGKLWAFLQPWADEGRGKVRKMADSARWQKELTVYIKKGHPALTVTQGSHKSPGVFTLVNRCGYQRRDASG